MELQLSRDPHGGAVTRRLLRRATAPVVVVVAGLLLSACGGAARPTLETVSTASQQHTQAAVRHVRQHRGESIVATGVTRSVPVYRSPGASHPFARLRNPTAVGAPLVFLVQSRRRGWEHVLLPMRPDGSTGWVKDRNVSLAWNPYSLVARLRTHTLVLRKNGRVAARFRAAVGRSVLPTPTGRYYIVELLKQPNPNGAYGPYAFGTSAFSKVLYHFGGGPGQIGIHGTDEHGSIGHSVSHGCIRLRNRDIVRLAHLLPLGTPVTILQ